MITFAFTILIASFVISNYCYNKGNKVKEYPHKDYFKLRFIMMLIMWILFILTLFNDNYFMNVFYLILILFFLYEFVFMSKKLVYFKS